MAGYIGKSQGVTQVDGYNRTEADDRYVNASGDTISGTLFVDGQVNDTDVLRVGYGLTELAVRVDSSDGELRLSAQDGSGNNYAKYMTFYTEGGSGPTEGMRIDNAGRVTKPWQPIWGGRHSGGNLNDFVTMYNDASVTNGSGWVLSGGSDERLYPPVSGWYQITMTGLANTSVDTQGHTQAYLYKSGVSQYNACAGTTNYTRMIIHAYLYLTPTDWISFYTGGTAMHTDQAYNKVTCMLVA